MSAPERPREAGADAAQAERRRLRIHGIVQGVGFRPFCHGLARRLGIAGWVLNRSGGVVAEIEGTAAQLDEFVARLRSEAPALARVGEIEAETIAASGERGFEIRASVSEATAGLVPPDVATCAECRREFSDPADRRFAYPFTNCTNCGPRYTIIRELPYDRAATSMQSFAQCAECAREYGDPGDRRFHAEPNACAACGPWLELVRSGSEAGERGAARDLLGAVRHLLRAGAVVAIKGLGGFHLACDAFHDGAVRRLRERKRRSDKPFAVMAANVAAVEEFAAPGEADRELLLDARRPIVIVPRRPGTSLSEAVAPGNRTIGVMLPYTPLHYLLFGGEEASTPEFTALVMTSGNLSEEPIAADNEDARRRLAPLADWLLLHNREIVTRVDDSVARTFEGRPRLLRRSRSYAPEPIELAAEAPPLLACGAELKNTFCLTHGRFAIVSQHIGDLENYETLQFFESTLEKLTRLFRVAPEAVAHDLHPQYLGTRWAVERSGLPAIGVQHHHAHIASCMAEHRLEGRVIGVALDGTGYGTDGAIWGGEFLVADFAGFERRAHLRYVALAGGDAAVREPWRPALAYLRDALGGDAEKHRLALWRDVPEHKRRVVEQMIRGGVNTVPTSSCGRLFDAVASIIGLRHAITYEGQAAIELEAAADAAVREQYSFDVEEGDVPAVDFRPAIGQIARECGAGVAVGTMAARFHNTLAAAIAEVCGRIGRRDGLRRVCLSGGTFQNMLLLERTVDRLRRAGLEVYTHARVPPNDGGIALGQAVIAAERLRRR